MRRAALVFLICTNSALANTAGDLMKWCEAYDAPGGVADAGRCTGYIDGVTDVQLSRAIVDMAFSSDGKATLPYCLPNAATLKQMRLVFMKYMRDNPENLHYPAHAQLGNSLAKAFPCQSR